MTESSKRAFKPSYNNGVDGLSSLPDAILCHILSFLDTKYAIATSVLSTRWKNLCSEVPNIYLDYDSQFGETRTRVMSESDFADFVRFGLRQIISRNVPYINKFHLRCDFMDPLTQTLVCAAIWRNVKELDICTLSRTFDMLILPPDIFTSRSLVVMKLRRYLDLPIPQLVCLPNLKVLHLVDVRFPCDHHSLRRLFDSCKLLEDLLLNRCRTLDPVDVVDFSIPSLRKLAIKYMLGATKLAIDTPNLEFFEYEGDQVEFGLVNEFKLLPIARICFMRCARECGSVCKLINKMHGIKFLHLSECTMRSMHCSCSSLCVLEDLTRLELSVFSFQALPSILQSTPQLQELVVSFPTIGYRRVGVAGASCSLPNVVPICFAEHLKSIVFKRFRAREYEFKLANYLLENGKVLKMMRFVVAVHQLEGEDLLAAFNTIARFPKSSAKCEIVFVSDGIIRNH